MLKVFLTSAAKQLIKTLLDADAQKGSLSMPAMGAAMFTNIATISTTVQHTYKTLKFSTGGASVQWSVSQCAMCGGCNLLHGSLLSSLVIP